MSSRCRYHSSVDPFVLTKVTVADMSDLKFTHYVRRNAMLYSKQKGLSRKEDVRPIRKFKFLPKEDIKTILTSNIKSSKMSSIISWTNPFCTF